jgi:hypothetical protein
MSVWVAWWDFMLTLGLEERSFERIDFSLTLRSSILENSRRLLGREIWGGEKFGSLDRFSEANTSLRMKFGGS